MDVSDSAKKIPNNKKKQKSLLKKRELYGWLFVSPFILGFLLIFLGIFVDSIRFSFMDVQTLPQGGFVTNFVKFANYHNILRVNPDFNRDLFNAVQNMLVDILIVIMFSLFIAVVLNQKMKGRALFRAVFFIPVILATGIIERADMNNSIMSAYQNVAGIDAGASAAAINELESGGLFSAAELRYYMEQIFSFSPLLTSITVGAANNIYNVVSSAGVQILIFLAGLQSISSSIYESAKIEGCSAWESFWKITLPMISPLIFTNVIYSIVDSFTRARNPVMNSITNSMGVGSYGEASAKAWVYFLVIAFFIGLISLIVSRFVFYQNKE